MKGRKPLWVRNLRTKLWKLSHWRDLDSIFFVLLWFFFCLFVLFRFWGFCLFGWLVGLVWFGLVWFHFQCPKLNRFRLVKSTSVSRINYSILPLILSLAQVSIECEKARIFVQLECYKSYLIRCF